MNILLKDLNIFTLYIIDFSFIFVFKIEFTPVKIIYIKELQYFIQKIKYNIYKFFHGFNCIKIINNLINYK